MLFGKSPNFHLTVLVSVAMSCDGLLEIMTVTLVRVIHIISCNLVCIVVVVFLKFCQFSLSLERERERERETDRQTDRQTDR